MRPPPSSIFLLRSFIASALALALIALPLHAGKRWIPWTTSAGGGASPPYDADFSGYSNANPIAGDWESGLGANGQVKILSNAAVPVSGGGVASVKASALTINSNQVVMVDIELGYEDDKQGPVARMQSNGAYYYAWWNNTFSTGNISKVDSAGTATEIGSRWSGNPTGDMRLGIECNGSSIRPFWKHKGTGVVTYLKAAETDSTLTGGQPGLWVNGGNVVKFHADNY